MTKDELLALCRALGYDPNHVAEIHLLPGYIEVRTYELDSEGKHYLTDRDGERVIADRWETHGYEIRRGGDIER